MPPKKTKNKKPHTGPPWRSGGSPEEELSPPEQVARRIIEEFADLDPSVERIMSAPITEDERTLAIGAFEGSLGVPGDPNRDPRVAIANATAGKLR